MPTAPGELSTWPAASGVRDPHVAAPPREVAAPERIEAEGRGADDGRAAPCAVRLGVGDEARPVILDAHQALLAGRVGARRGVNAERAHDPAGGHAHRIAVEHDAGDHARLDPLGRLTLRLRDRLAVVAAGVQAEPCGDQLEQVGKAAVDLAQKNRLLRCQQLEPGQALARRLLGGFHRAV